MPCQCKELERRHHGGGCKCIHYRKDYPDCECEKYSVSDHSPGLVENGELLIRTVYSPIQINQTTGQVDPAFFRNDALKRGLSINRKHHVSHADLRKKIECKIARDRNEGKERDEFYRVVTARCGDVRRLVSEDGERLFCAHMVDTEIFSRRLDALDGYLGPAAKPR